MEHLKWLDVTLVLPFPIKSEVLHIIGSTTSTFFAKLSILANLCRKEALCLDCLSAAHMSWPSLHDHEYLGMFVITVRK